MLIVLAGPTSNSDTRSSIDDSEQSGYLLPSVVGAMYLLVASTTHDLHAGYSLLVDGNSACHQAFGLALLVVYGIMVAAAMTVLVSTSADSVSVVLNAVTVLFISDLVRTTQGSLVYRSLDHTCSHQCILPIRLRIACDIPGTELMHHDFARSTQLLAGSVEE